jgi:hypothetical protein
MAKKVFSQEGGVNSTHRLQQLAASVPDKTLNAAGVPTKYWAKLRSLNKVSFALPHCCSSFLTSNIVH